MYYIFCLAYLEWGGTLSPGAMPAELALDGSNILRATPQRNAPFINWEVNLLRYYNDIVSNSNHLN